jgi:hypothetical protein
MTSVQRAVLRFPAERVARPARGGATWLEIRTWRLRRWLGRTLNSFRAPGAIRDVEVQDALTGQRLKVLVGELFVCVNVNGRDYYFDRITGRFDGTGASPG